MNISRISALAEFERFGIPFEPLSNDAIKFKCPVHEDKNPSASLNTKTNKWKCFASSCEAKGDIVSLLARFAEVSRAAILEELSSRYDLETIKSINPERVEKMHVKIWNKCPLIQKLYDRGVTDEMIRAARLGYDKGRIQIPVYQSNHVINIRKYLPGAPGHEKMYNTKGFGKYRLYQRDDLLDNDKKVWILAGEIKALVVKHLLPEIAAVCVTAGEGAWDNTFNKLFKGREIYICMDIDKAGKKAANKLASILSQVTDKIKIINLPLDPEKYPKGDVNDYIGQEGAGRDELAQLMVSAEPFTGKLDDEEDIKLIEKNVSLAQVTLPDNTKFRLRFEAIAASADTTPYLVPKKISVDCTKDQTFCHKCPANYNSPQDDGCMRIEIQPSSDKIMSLIDSSISDEKLQLAIGMPACKTSTLNVEEYHSVRDVRLVPQLRIGEDSHDNVRQPAFIVNNELNLNIPYTLTGRTYPHPKSQQATLVVDIVEEASDSLTRFELTDELERTLTHFRPLEWTVEALSDKLDDIYHELETNVTQIYDRQDMHIAMDLVWHSTLFFNLLDKRVNGWTNTLILGDSAQGKSETARCLLDFYGLGEWVECKNATVPGLVGGLQQIGSRWFVSWGIIPTHDRGLVVLEEAKGMPTEYIGKMTDMRSRGIAEIPKIEHSRTFARTRLLWISNPRSTRPLAGYAFGVEAMTELIGSLEDVRRFDLLYIAASSRDIDRTPRPKIETTYTKEACTALILLAWTRGLDQIRFEDEMYILKCANQLIADFSDGIPIIDKGTTHHKVARLAAALAVRTFSVENGCVVVRTCHVDFIVSWLRKIYSDTECGYDRFSEASKVLNTIDHPGQIKRIIEDTKHAPDLVEGLLYTDEITQLDIQDLCSADRDSAQKIISQLVRARGLRRKGRQTYAKTPDMIEILKGLVGKVKSKINDYEKEFGR